MTPPNAASSTSVLVVSRRDLGVSLDTQAALEELARPRPALGTFTRVRVALGGLPPEPVDVAPSYRCDAAVAGAWLASIAPGLKIALCFTSYQPDEASAFFKMVALNRGTVIEFFNDEIEARTWLLERPADAVD